jgi:hypothetical protein
MVEELKALTMVLVVVEKVVLELALYRFLMLPVMAVPA